MKLSQIKTALNTIQTVAFALPDGEKIPPHFHITEVGLVKKHFIDCGGTLRKEAVISFQLYTATDYDHRLSVQKLGHIIDIAKKQLNLNDLEVEVEYQSNTIGKYGLDFKNGVFVLVAKQTDCLAKDNCGIPKQKPKVRLSELQKQERCCTPNSVCC